MTRIGYALSSEEHGPLELVALARRAEECGFPFALVSDHFHPWTSRQGQSPFVWSVIGGIAQATERLELGTGVTCPATAAAMLPGRFFLGLGTGENLNEHVTGERWPSAGVRLSMLAEAIDVIRVLWEGREESFHGDHYTVEDARLYTLPDVLPPIAVAAAKPAAATLAGELGDALVSTAPDAELVSRFEAAGGRGKPRYGQLTVCYADDEAEARRIAREWWPNAAVKGDLGQELPRPAHFEQAASMVSEDQVAEAVVCGPDAERHLQAIDEFSRAGFDHVYVHQVGPDQEGFFRFYEREILPRHEPEARAAA